jgi:DNA-binding SARP family transcriptional activator
LRLDVARTPLLDRLRAAEPAIVAIVAPAGFGKSTLMRQFGSDFPAFSVCDCATVRSALDLAKAVAGALGREPERGPGLAQTVAYLAETSASEADRLEAALAAWREPVDRAAFAFENAESALGEPAARELFERLLTARPDGRTVVICSRETPRMHLSRFAAPHRIAGVRAADLAFTRAEIDALFVPLGCDEAARDDVAALSAGWPIAVLLLARLAAEGRLEPLLDELGDVAFDELYEYLADHVLEGTPPGAIDGMLACAAIPRATVHDLQLVLDEPRAIETFLAFQKTSPFVARTDDGAWIVHPLVAATLLGRHAARADALLERAARAYRAGGAYERVAELELARDDHVAAAEALDRSEPAADDVPTPAFAQVLFALDHAVVQQYPRLWSIATLLRTFTVDARAQLAEGDAVQLRVKADATPSVRAYLTVFRAMLLSYAGDCDRGLALIAELGRIIGLPEIPATSLHGWLLQLRASMSARLGRLAEAERDLDAAWSFVSATHLTAAAALLTAGAEIARARGDRSAEREHLEAALVRVRAAGLGNIVALHLAENALGAWLAGDDAAGAEYRLALEAEIVCHGARAFAFFAAALRGEAREPETADHPKWIVCGHLIAAAQAADPATALRHADAAREAAAVYRAPLYAAFAALAAGELDPARRDIMYAEAAECARAVASPALHVAVAELRRREAGGFLAPFAARYQAARDRAQPRGEIRVELVTGRVLRAGAPLALADRELALLVAVAVRREARSREALTELLWPELTVSAARNAFHVCLHRLKTRLGDDDAIVRSGEGYRLGVGVRLDLPEIDRLASALRAGGESADAPDAAAALYERLRAVRPPKFAEWEWFEPTERRLCELRSTLAQKLAARALEAGRWEAALALCDELIAHDSCDEPAREIAIRAYLAAGDRPAALRHFRQYRATLMSELGCEPSRWLAELLGADTL